jgi:hypothetical protein
VRDSLVCATREIIAGLVGVFVFTCLTTHLSGGDLVRVFSIGIVAFIGTAGHRGAAMTLGLSKEERDLLVLITTLKVLLYPA